MATISTPVQYRFDGEAASKPSNDVVGEIEGYTFSGNWMLDGAAEAYNFTVGVTESIVLYAQWDVKTFTVTWMNEANEIYRETYEYGANPEFKTIHNGGKDPEKSSDEYYSYTFIGWNEDQDPEDTLTLLEYRVTRDVTLYAIFSKQGQNVRVTFMISYDGGAYELYQQLDAKYSEEITLTFAEYAWFIGDGWYFNEERTEKALTINAKGSITLYGAYVFDIGNGDVNADRIVDTDDIVIFREWIVGGYEMTVVEKGTEWTLLSSDDFDANGRYFLMRTADVNADTSVDIRDITTIRMAIVGNYGWRIVTNVTVTGQAVAMQSEGTSQLTYSIVEVTGHTGGCDNTNNTITVNCDSADSRFAIAVSGIEGTMENSGIASCVVVVTGGSCYNLSNEGQAGDTLAADGSPVMVTPVYGENGTNIFNGTITLNCMVDISKVSDGTTFTVTFAMYDSNGFYQAVTYTITCVKTTA